MQDFDEIYAQYYDRVYKYLLRLCWDRALAEELTQESFCKAFRSIGRFKGECQLSSWLCEIAKNAYLSHQRRERRRAGPPSEALEDGNRIESSFLDRETAREIHRALHGLREPYKEVFWLRLFGELSFLQISQLFGKSESWARVTYYRAKIMIQEAMK